MKNKFLAILILIVISANLVITIYKVEQIKQLAAEVQKQQIRIEKIEHEL